MKDSDLSESPTAGLRPLLWLHALVLGLVTALSGYLLIGFDAVAWPALVALLVAGAGTVLVHRLLRRWQAKVERRDWDYRSLVTTSEDYLWHADATGKRLTTSRGFQQLTGCDVPMLRAAGQSWLDVLHPRDRDEVLAEWNRAVAERRPSRIEARLRLADGGYRHFLCRSVPVRATNGEIHQWVGSCTDIEKLKQNEFRLRVRDRGLVHAAQGGGVSLWEWDLNERRVIFSVGLAEQLGYRREELPTTPEGYVGLFHPEDVDQGLGRLQRLPEEAEVFDAEYRMRHRDGSYRWLRTRAIIERDPLTGCRHFVGANMDVTELKRAQQDLDFTAHHDELTGLPNRRLMRQSLHELCELARERDERLGVLAIDIDHFRVINESYGHTFADQLLIAVAARLGGCLRRCDMVGRTDGDEFIAIVGGNPDQKEIALLGRQILEAVVQPFEIQGHSVSVTTTVGGSMYPSHTSDPATLICYADSALYRGKSLGRNRFRLFSSYMEQRGNEWLRIKTGLSDALERGELRVVYQPQYDLRSDRVVSFEALLRWESAELGEVPLQRFIPVAESSGMMRLLGRFVLEQAVARLAEWREVYLGRELRVAVNISASQLYHPDFVSTIEQVVAAAGVPFQQLELEISESVLMENVQLAATRLEELAALGLRLIIDNFGARYSSLNHLGALSAHALKIDRRFVHRVNEDSVDGKVARAVIALAHSLGRQVIAMGVETAEELQLVRKHDCDLAQGYYFSMPVAGEDVFGGASLKAIG